MVVENEVMCTIADAKVQINYNCYNVYFYECLHNKYLYRYNKKVTATTTNVKL